MNWRGGEPNPKILQHSAAFFQRFDYGVALKIYRKISHLNIAFDRYASYRHCNALHFVNKRTANKICRAPETNALPALNHLAHPMLKFSPLLFCSLAERFKYDRI